MVSRSQVNDTKHRRFVVSNSFEEPANVGEGPAGGLDAIVEVPIIDAHPHFIFCLLYNHGVTVIRCV